ncbi:MAG: hypothetical protein LUG99_03925 [Lachnospiraceae bacterium]|nr:hypothetical protein [Lachnospiraceae bacterium]
MCERCSPEAEPGFDIYQIALTAKKDMKRGKEGDYSVEEVFYIAIKKDSES